MNELSHFRELSDGYNAKRFVRDEAPVFLSFAYRKDESQN